MYMTQTFDSAGLLTSTNQEDSAALQMCTASIWSHFIKELVEFVMGLVGLFLPTHPSWRPRIGWRSRRRGSRSQTRTWWRAGFPKRWPGRGQSSRSTFPPPDRSHPHHHAPPHSRTCAKKPGDVNHTVHWSHTFSLSTGILNLIYLEFRILQFSVHAVQICDACGHTRIHTHTHTFTPQRSI